MVKKKAHFQDRFSDPPKSSFPFAIAFDRAVLRESMLGFASEFSSELGTLGLSEGADTMDFQATIKLLSMAHDSFLIEWDLMGRMSSGNFIYDSFPGYVLFRSSVEFASTFGFRAVRVFLLVWSGAIVFSTQPIRRTCIFCPGNCKITAAHLFNCPTVTSTSTASIRVAIQRKHFRFVFEATMHLYFAFRSRLQFSIFDDDDDAALFECISPFE